MVRRCPPRRAQALLTIAQAGLQATVVGDVVGVEPGARRCATRASSPCESYDLIGCGALNLDLIYRLPTDSPLWRKLPPPGAEQAVGAELRTSVEAALAGFERTRRGGGQAAKTAYALARLAFSAAMLGRMAQTTRPLLIDAGPLRRPLPQP